MAVLGLGWGSSGSKLRDMTSGVVGRVGGGRNIASFDGLEDLSRINLISGGWREILFYFDLFLCSLWHQAFACDTLSQKEVAPNKRKCRF